MRVILILALGILLIGTAAIAQSASEKGVVAKPEDQAVIKVLVDAEAKAKQALDAKIATLPEYQAWKDASAKTLREAYKLQAKQQLSSMEYKPQLNEKGELEFVKIEQKP